MSDAPTDDDLYAFPRNLVLAASAGTGKTHALVGVVLDLLIADRPPSRGTGRAEPVDPARIVATTFSRKAAAEIRARVVREVERLASEPSTSLYRSALHRRGRSGRTLSDDDLRVRARRALARLPAARFGTLHSFATGIVRAHAVELGLGPGFELATEADARGRADEAIARALEGRLATTPDAVRGLAEAASGIDRLVVQLRRLLTQLEEDGRAARDLAVPGDRDVVALEAGMRRFVDHARDLLRAPKFEDAARELLAAWSDGATPDAVRLEATAAALSGIPATGKKTPEVESFAVFRKTLLGTTNDEKGRRLARAFLFRHRFADQAALVRDILAEAEADIESTGRARAAIGFGEVLRAARELLRDRPDVAEEVAAGMDALLVDEFQDTSRVQRDLLQLLWAKPAAREAGRVPPLSAVRERGLLVVGDRKQSIYGFRGADVGVFAELAVGLAGGPAREALGIPPGVTWEPREPLADFRALRHNRRSVPAVLAFANAFSARRFRPGDPPPELFEIEYVPATEDLLVPPERAPASQAFSPRTTWLRVRPKGTSSTRLEEALVIAERIGRLVRGPAEERPLAWRDIAVLATSNSMLDATAFALAQAEIPYIVAGKSFFRAREVRDLAAMLALVLDPSDRLAALEVLRGPWASVHDETLLGLVRPGDGLASPHRWPEMVHAGGLVREEDRAVLLETSALVLELARSAGRLGPAAILREALAARSLEAVLAALPRGEQRVANVQKLLAIAERHVDARAFRTWLDDAAEQEVAESEAATFSEEDDAVRLLTVHASKGLDFPVVFVPEIGSGLPRSEKGVARIALGSGDEPNVLAVRVALEDGAILEPPSFAAAYATTRRRERAERQRLAYVATTRAADAMFLVGGRAKESAGDPGITSLVALEDLASDDRTREAAGLVVEDTEVPAAELRGTRTAPGAVAEPHGEGAAPSGRTSPSAVPRWRSLPIAPTALADFEHCPRRFELVHVLGLPEHVRGGVAPLARRAAGPLDARSQGTLAHAVLERVPPEVFGAAAAEAAGSAGRALAAEGVPHEHPQHAAIVGRVSRFLEGAYASAIRADGAELRREVPFVLPLEDEQGRAVVLRGNMDLVVAWKDGSVDVVDYKSARGGPAEAYAFQLDVYALAARAIFPAARRLRAGLVYLGGAGAAGEPKWRPPTEERELRARLAAMGDDLLRARWTGLFPRVELARCESIYCGFIGRCHPTPTGGSPEGSGTEA